MAPRQSMAVAAVTTSQGGAASAHLLPPPLSLTVVAGPVKGHVAFKSKFGASSFTIGRIVRVDFTVRDESVSSRHAEARWDARRRTWTLVDVGSSNGTWVVAGGGEKKELLAEGQPRDIKAGDRILLGPETVVLVTAVGDGDQREAEEEKKEEAAAAAGGGRGRAAAAAAKAAAAAAAAATAVDAEAAAPTAAAATTAAAAEAAAGGRRARRKTGAAPPPPPAAADDEDEGEGGARNRADDAGLLRDMEGELRQHAAAAQARVRAAAERAAAELRAEWAAKQAALMALAAEAGWDVEAAAAR